MDNKQWISGHNTFGHSTYLYIWRLTIWTENIWTEGTEHLASGHLDGGPKVRSVEEQTPPGVPTRPDPTRPGPGLAEPQSGRSPGCRRHVIGGGDEIRSTQSRSSGAGGNPTSHRHAQPSGDVKDMTTTGESRGRQRPSKGRVMT